MPLVLVAGISGAGKSSVCVELRRRGYEAHDVDFDGNAVWIDRESGRVYPGDAYQGAESVAWFEKHDWCVVPERVAALAQRAEDRLIFLCGMTKNENEVAHLFARVVYLSIDARDVRRRVGSRTTNDFGRAEHEMAAILDWLEVAEREHREAGAVIVDATQPLPKVVDDVLRAVGEAPYPPGR